MPRPLVGAAMARVRRWGCRGARWAGAQHLPPHSRGSFLRSHVPCLQAVRARAEVGGLPGRGACPWQRPEVPALSGLGGDLHPHPRVFVGLALGMEPGVAGGHPQLRGTAPSSLGNRDEADWVPKWVAGNRGSRTEPRSTWQPLAGVSCFQNTQPFRSLPCWPWLSDPLLPSDGLQHWGPGRTPFAVGASVCTLEALSRPSSGEAEPTASVCPSGPRRES